MRQASEIQLKIMSTSTRTKYQRDIGRNIARIDYDSMETVSPHINTGDCVKIRGKRTTYAKALPVYPSDEGKKFISLDKYSMQNAQVRINSKVNISKAKYERAERVLVRPVKKLENRIDERFLADALESQFATEGDLVAVPYFGGRLEFNVLECTPKNKAVCITQYTIFNIEYSRSIQQHINDLYDNLKAENYNLTVSKRIFIRDITKSVNQELEKK